MECYRCFVAAALWIAAAACAASTAGFIGSYVAIEGHRATMTISEKLGKLRIELKGGANAGDSDSVAGDCEAVAEGNMSGSVIKAKLVPFEGKVSSLDAGDIERMDSGVLVDVQKQIATVRGSFAHCGLRNALNGKYKKL